MSDASHSQLREFLRALFPWAVWIGLIAGSGIVLAVALRVPGAFLWGSGLVAVVLVLFRWALDFYRLRSIQRLFFSHHMLPVTSEKLKGFTPWSASRDLRTVLRAAVFEFQKTFKKMKETSLALEKFVGAKAAAQSTRNAARPALGGDLKAVFCLFADVRGFTSMTEKLRPEETVEILNRIFTALEEVLAQYGGEINKYIGDAIFAYFRCPYENEELAARNVLRAALRMQEAFDALNLKMRHSYSQPVEIGLGVGLTAGTAILGSVGSANRMEFTLIGDVVNLASRLCSIARPTEILVNEEMAEKVQEYFDMTALAPVELKGKSGIQVPYVIVGERLLLTKGLVGKGRRL